MEKNKVNFIVYVLIFCVAIAGIGGFYLGKSFGEKTIVEKESDKPTEVDKTDKKNDAMTAAEIDSLGRSLFDKTEMNSILAEREFYFYDEKEMNYDKLSNEKRLEIALNLLSENKIKYSDFAEEDNYPESCWDASSSTNNCFAMKFDVKDLEQSYHDIFGQSKEFKMETFESDMDCLTCKLENESIACYKFGCGGDSDVATMLNYHSAELKNDNLYVYSRYLAFGEEGIYSDLKHSNIIAETEDLSKEELFNKYGDKASKFKLTFKKDTNNNWYWVSTEATN